MFDLPKEIVVLDLEITTWEGALGRYWSGENEHMEIIQIGAVKAETDTFEILDTFSECIKPKINPVLSEYCKELTGITQDQIDGAQSFDKVIKKFDAWCGDLPIYSFGKMKDLPQSLDRDAFIENATLFNVTLPFDPHSMGSVDKIFRAYGYTVEQSGSAPKAFGQEIPHEIHDALNDAKGLVLGLKALRDVVLEKKGE